MKLETIEKANRLFNQIQRLEVYLDEEEYDLDTGFTVSTWLCGKDVTKLLFREYTKVIREKRDALQRELEAL